MSRGPTEIDDRSARAFVARWLAWLEPGGVEDATGSGWDRVGEVVGRAGGPRVRVVSWREGTGVQFDPELMRGVLEGVEYALVLVRPGAWAHPDDWARAGVVTGLFPAEGEAGAVLVSRGDPLGVRGVVGLMERPPEDGQMAAWRHALEAVHARTLLDAFTIAAIRQGAGHRWSAWVRERGMLSRVMPRATWWRGWTVVRVWGGARVEGVHVRPGEPAMPWEFVWRGGVWRREGEGLVCEGSGMLAVVGEDVTVRLRGIGEGSRAVMRGPRGGAELALPATGAPVVLRVMGQGMSET